jgi:hypothetical protein
MAMAVAQGSVFGAGAPSQREAMQQGLRSVEKSGLVPLCDMGKADRYKGEDGGLYGEGRNEAPEPHAAAARRALAQIRPLDAEGKPAADGRIVLLSIGMSNTTQEFSRFKELADKDAKRSPRVVVVDGALGGMDVEAWATSRRTEFGTPWEGADRRLAKAGVTPKQVQAVWLKQAKIGPARSGEFPAHARELADGMRTILNMAQERYPNLRIAYLSSRTYAGYAATPLNPEPYAYESAFACRRLIREQMQGDPKLNFDPDKGAVKSPVLLWGPYLWTDGTAGRKSDGLVWAREDTAKDGTHPSDSGRLKVARLLLALFQTNPLARSWYCSESR